MIPRKEEYGLSRIKGQIIYGGKLQQGDCIQGKGIISREFGR